MARLIIHGPGGSSRRVEVARGVFRIGRALDNDLLLDADGVSDHHAQLTRGESGYVLSGTPDSGTLVNDAPAADAPLHTGDEIRLGSARLVFEYDEGDPAPQASLDEQRVSVEQLADEHTTLGGPHQARDAERFGLLYNAGKKVLSASSLEDVTNLVLPLVFDAVRAERGALLLRDPATGEMRPRLLRHRDGRPLPEGELHVPRSIVSEVVNGRLGILTFDALHDPRFEQKASVKRSHIRSALCAPLWEGENILGVIYLDSRLKSHAFTRADLVLLSAIANLIAIRLRQDALNEQLAEERVVRSTLQRYHSPDVVDAILARAKDRAEPELGLEEREISILFGDLQGWTPLAEAQDPAVVAEFLNEYYAMATQIVFAHGGSVNEYLGDAVMAVFGAPVIHEDPAQRAVQAGLEILSEMRSRSEGLIAQFGSQARIAINTGRTMVGNVGPPNRLKYAVVGDTVNVASRLEGMGEPNTITIGEQTYRQLSEREGWEDLGPLQLRGREKPVRGYRMRVG